MSAAQTRPSPGPAGAASGAAQAASPLAWRAAWVLLALAALLVASFGTWLQRERGELPSAALTPTSWPRVLDGAEVASEDEARFLARRHPPGTTLAFEDGGPSVLLGHEVTRMGQAITWVSVLAYLAVVALVLAPRAGRPAVRSLGVAMSAAALGIGIGGIYAPRAPLESILLVAYVLALCAMPLGFALTTLRFPVPSPVLERAPWLPWGLAALGLGVGGWNAALWLAYARAPSPARWQAASAAFHAVEALLVLGFALGVGRLVWAGRRTALTGERAQARWLLWGIAVAATPYVFLRTLPRLVGLAEPPIPSEVDRLVELVAPAAFAIAVARHRLFDIDAVIRRSLIASVLALLLLGAALTVALTLGRLAPEAFDLPREATWLLAGLVAGALFVPARRAVGRLVDRVFFRIRHQHGLALKALAGQLAEAPTPQAVSEALTREVRAALGVERILTLVHDRASGAAREALAALEGAGLGDGIVRARQDATTVAAVEGAPWPAGFGAPDLVLVQPLATRGRLWGAVGLGARPGGHRFVEEDLAFLAAAAAQAGQALERLDLVRTLAAEAGAREALASLDRQRREFLLRVAHDLRTPLTAVRWATANLKDGLAGPLAPAQLEEVGGILAASGQLGRLVENLVALSRLEVGGVGEATFEPVALGPLVTETIAALKPVAQAKGVRFETRLDEVPPARGRRDGWSQVVQNLLDNAVKYAPPGSGIEVVLARDAAAGGSGLVLSVRDHGPGLAGKDPATLFDLFRQGAASPHASAKGLGVGLHVVKSWVEAFGGRVEGAEHPEGGAVFTCRMASWEAPPRAGGGSA